MPRFEYQIGVALLVALLLGWLCPQSALALKPLGALYLQLLRFVVVPLLFLAIFSAVVGMRDVGSLGKMALGTFGLYLISTLLALTLSITLMDFFRPGEMLVIDMTPTMQFSTGSVTLEAFIALVVPENIALMFAQSNMLQLVVVAIVFGIAAMSLSEVRSHALLVELGDALLALVMKVTMWIIALTPLGILGLVAPMVAVQGVGVAVGLGGFVAVVLAALFGHLLITLPLLGWMIAKINVYRYLYALRTVLLFAFSTASSSATLPLALRQASLQGGVHAPIAKWVLSIGSTVNMDGTALYQAAVALLVVQALGLEWSITQQLIMALTVVLASIGTAGIPGAGLVVLATLFATMGLPLEAIGVVMVVDRALDAVRTMVNVSGDLVIAKIIDRRFGLKQSGNSQRQDDTDQ